MEKKGRGEMTVTEIGRKLLEQLDRFHRISCRHEMLLNMNRNEMVVLTLLEHLSESDSSEKGVKPSELTHSGFMSKPAISRMLSSMEKKGYIGRCMSEDDRRVVYVKLTESGRRKLEEEKRHRDQMAEKIFRRMGVEKMEQLLALIEEIVEYAAEEMTTCSKTKHKTSEGEQTL